MDGGQPAGHAADRPPEFVEALARGMAVLEAFDAEHGEMTLSEIARRAGTSPAAARRALITLEELGYVGQSNRRFSPRPKLLTLGASFYGAARVADLLQPNLREIVAEFGDASSVAVLDGTDVIYVAHLSVQRARRPAATVGARYPAWATSLGRAILSGLPDEEVALRLAEADPHPLTDACCTDPAALADAVRAARTDGYAVTVDQLDYGITAIAVPVRAPDGRTVAALNSSGYTGRVTPESLVAERLPALRAAAIRIGDAIRRTPVLQAVLGG